MEHLLLIGEKGLLRDLIKQHLGRASSISVIEMDPDEIPAGPVDPVSTTLIVLTGIDRAAERAVPRLRAEYPSLPICIILERDDRETALRALELGVQGIVSARSCAQSLLPVLELLKTGESFFPATLVVNRSGAGTPHAGSVPSLPRPATVDGLTTRERQVAEVLFRGQPNKIIARELGLRENTVKIHVRNVLKKMGVRTRGQAVAVAVRDRDILQRARSENAA